LLSPAGVVPPARKASRGRRSALYEQQQRFTHYMPFGLVTTTCLAVFLLVYATTLLVLSPLLNQEAPHSTNLHRGDVLRPVLDNAVEKVKHLPQEVAKHGVVGESQKLAEGVASAVKKKIDQLRHHNGVSDAELMNRAAEELRKARQSKQLEKQQKDKESFAVANAPVAPGKRTGFMVMGMHRSGTSMLSGLMATGMGYKVGGPLIGGSFDNVKGFFERIDVVSQNDEFMKKQGVWWSANMMRYDADKAYQMYQNKQVDFTEGAKALQFFNDPNNVPWMQKDPRQCLTLRTWLKLMSSEPAILFTYRHPLEVAMSLKKREQDFTVEHGLRLWIVYNMRAIQNTEGLCIVYTSNEDVLEDPLTVVTRISQELTAKCGVPKPPEALTNETVNQFIDPSLQHNKNKDEGEGHKVLADHDGCQVREYESPADQDPAEKARELNLYLTAMKIYCDFKSGEAYKPGYAWPELPK
jgi:hypothetical protein